MQVIESIANLKERNNEEMVLLVVLFEARGKCLSLCQLVNTHQPGNLLVVWQLAFCQKASSPFSKHRALLVIVECILNNQSESTRLLYLSEAV